MAPGPGKAGHPMTTAQGETPLKVCHTCRHWSYRYKGYCARLSQGVGRFWMCEEWVQAAVEEPQEGGIPEGSVVAPPPS
jgi:hypothetical protein